MSIPGVEPGAVDDCDLRLCGEIIVPDYESCAFVPGEGRAIRGKHTPQVSIVAGEDGLQQVQGGHVLLALPLSLLHRHCDQAGMSAKGEPWCEVVLMQT